MVAKYWSQIKRWEADLGVSVAKKWEANAFKWECLQHWCEHQCFIPLVYTSMISAVTSLWANRSNTDFSEIRKGMVTVMKSWAGKSNDDYCYCCDHYYYCECLPEQVKVIKYCVCGKQSSKFWILQTGGKAAKCSVWVHFYPSSIFLGWH